VPCHRLAKTWESRSNDLSRQRQLLQPQETGAGVVVRQRIAVRGEPVLCRFEHGVTVPGVQADSSAAPPLTLRDHVSGFCFERLR